VIFVEGLTKSYGEIHALRGMDFQVEQGEIVGLLGPNGAGKSTAIKCLTGYLHPDKGSVHVDGINVLDSPIKAQKRIGYLPENTPLYPEMSVQAYLQMIAELRDVPDEVFVEKLSDAIIATGLGDRLTQPIGQLSKGLRQRVGLAQAILHKPRLLILDEPTIGLDPTQIVEIRNLIKDLSVDSTILFSSHILSEVEAVCDRVIILVNGEVQADSRLGDIAQTSDATLIVEHVVPDIESMLTHLDGVKKVKCQRMRDGHYSCEIVGDTGVDLCPAIYDLARKQQWPLRELRRDVRTLETVFNELVSIA
tara:strand:- start:10098 stop:11018 length:921 start_codon:yes stop_codon:yes gene_type:complete